MKKSFLLIFLLAFASITCLSQVKSENLFYMIDTPESFNSFSENIHQISVVCPQTYLVSDKGTITGTIDPRVLQLAKENNVKVIPLIVNFDGGFSQELLHKLLADPIARKRSIDMMVELAKRHGFAGWQFDLESLSMNDKTLFNTYYKEVADAFRKSSLSLSAALMHVTDIVGGTDLYHRFLYEDWRGGFDYKYLAETGDFISIMTYDQHTRRTPPGPVAGFDWVEKVITFAIKQGVSPEKISMGIPTYGHYWFADYTKEKGGFVNGRQIPYQQAMHLIHKNNAQVVWNEKAQCHYAFWDNEGVYEYVYFEDEASFAKKLELLSSYKLRGISVWVLGREADNFWKTLKENTIRK